MSKYHTYHYNKGIVKLDFSFEDNAKIIENKTIFIELLQKAVNDLKDELK